MKIIDTQGRPVFDPEFLTIEPNGRIFLSRLPKVATSITLISNTAYFVYIGRVTQPMTVKYVEFYVNTGGSGSPQAGEVGLFRTPNAPNKTDQGPGGIVKLAATDNLGTLTGAGVRRNTNSFDYAVPVGTHLWAGIRTAMPTTQPALAGLCMDFSEGLVLSVESAGTLMNAGPWYGAVPVLGSYLNSAVAPDLRIALD